ncbi:MAG: hypothetical protein WBQ85_08760 [Candidatus Sulfotelmatobacter sp.]
MLQEVCELHSAIHDSFHPPENSVRVVWQKGWCCHLFIDQKRELPPIDDPDLYRLKQEIVSELRRFLRNLRSAFSRRRTSPSSDEIIDHFQKTILSESDTCIHLKTNMNSWVKFFRGNSISVKLLLHGKRTSPAALFDSWFAWCKGFEPETIRQRISEVGQFVRDSRKS